MEENTEQKIDELSLEHLVQSPQIQDFISDIAFSPAFTKNLNGIVNIVGNFEDPTITSLILRKAFPHDEELFQETRDLDAVALQNGRAGKGISVRTLDELIYGTYKVELDPKTKQEKYVFNPTTREIERNQDGLTNRPSLKAPLPSRPKDRRLIVKNLDYCLDFCKDENEGRIDSRALYILEKFRDINVRNNCCLILVTNKKLDLPFDMHVLEMPPVNRYEANHIINVILENMRNKVDIDLSELQRKKICKKVSGLTYTEAYRIIQESLYAARSDTLVNNKISIDATKAVSIVRNRINQKMMEGGHGLTQLVPRPWEDYICSEHSNFTYDVQKLLRDFEEVDFLRNEKKKAEQSINKANMNKTLKKIEAIDKTVEDLNGRMPHVIVLYGQGGVGKSAFPVHLAGLLGMDVWDFNVNATHSKWIGQGSEQMRKSLDRISKTSNVIIRIDEYDRAMGSTNEGGGGMHEAHKQVESEFMNFLQNAQEDNLFVKNNIFIVMTTNHKENFTGPMLRSGRVDLAIDIGEFDVDSMKEAFSSCARRMSNRGVSVIGFKDVEDLQKAIDELDIDKLAELATTKKFTVRDVETLIIEMGAHRYYHKKGKSNIPWTTEAFVEVLENSEGSVKGASTGELKLGDRDFGKQKAKPEKVEFADSISDTEKLKETHGFTEE